MVGKNCGIFFKQSCTSGEKSKGEIPLKNWAYLPWMFSQRCVVQTVCHVQVFITPEQLLLDLISVYNARRNCKEVGSRFPCTVLLPFAMKIQMQLCSVGNQLVVGCWNIPSFWVHWPEPGIIWFATLISSTKIPSPRDLAEQIMSHPD